MPKQKPPTIEEMREALVPWFLDTSFGDGCNEDIVRYGFKGIWDMSKKEVREAYAEMMQEAGVEEE